MTKMKTLSLSALLLSFALTPLCHAKRSPSPPIQFYNRETKTIETESVYGNKAVRFGYENKLGFFLSKHILSHRWVSKLVGSFENRKRSAKKIAPFISTFNIDMSQFEDRSYETFNQFFTRKFKEGMRPFDASDSIFSAGTEARYLVAENVSLTTTFPVKGTQIYLPELFGDEKLAEEFIGGTVIIARLCPVDYHRFHFPLSGEVLNTKRIHGSYYSVNPIALNVKPDILFKNERQVSLMKNSEFGTFAIIEVGAFAVGKIVQTAYSEESTFPVSVTKGSEKGYFEFGASTVIWVLKKGAIQLDPDLVQNSQIGLETWVKLGDHLGTAPAPLNDIH